MADKKQMTDAELLALIGSYEKSALGSSVSAGPSVGGSIKPAGQTMTTLEIDRYNALNAYFARPIGNEIEDRSQIVLPELRDTVEWIMPTLMAMFVGSGKPVQFDPESPGDEDQAEIETEVVNWVFMRQNPGFIILHDFLKDALLLRNGYVNSYWLKKRKTVVESYTGLNEIELAMLLQTDDEIEILEQTEEIKLIDGPMGQQQTTTFDIKLRRTKKVGQVKVECVPPEEMRVSPQARHGFDESPFTEHECKKTRSELIEMGFDANIVNGIEVAQPDWLDLIELARNEVTDQLSEENPTDPASQLVSLRTVFIRVDFDGDGIAELRRVMVGGDKILDNDECEEVSYSYCSPIRMPHRHVGISYYDLLYDLQVIKTTLFRQALDNIYISNNQRLAVDWQNVNMGDLLTSRPGGIIRTTGSPGMSIMPLDMPSNLMSQILPALEYCDLQREMRTGIGKDTMGVDADALQDVTKGGQLAAMSAAGKKVELVARLMAEGVKDIFLKIHGLLRRHQDEELTFRLTDKRWINANPADWSERTEVVPNVGLGSGNREEARANVMMLGQAQGQLAQFGLVGPKQAYNTFRKMSHLLGFENPTEFAMDPDSPEFQQQQAQHPPQPNPAVQVAQIKEKGAMDRAQLEAQTTAQQTQSKQATENARLQGDLIKAQAAERSAQLHAQAEVLHSAHQSGADRDVQLAQINSQEWQTVFKVLGQIAASQLKQDPTANAGQVMNQDMSEVQRGV
ncbi:MULTISPECIES: portal protein [Paraburkholderia]|uniref:portal protein n=1 Tax=Paraburkholderia TaxID=1822464 RepID=UPI0038BA31BE